MMKLPANRTLHTREAIFQLILHLLVFTFYIYDREQPWLESHQPFYFLNYALGAALINYLWLPRFFYKKRYLVFSLLSLLTIFSVFLIEELVLEKIYFPDTLGSNFHGPLHSLLAVFPVIMILSGFKFAWDALQKQQEMDELRASVEQSELRFLQSQINPHFLFNNLNNLYSYAIVNAPETPAIILELSEVLRYMLYDCREKYVGLSKEIEQLDNFTQLNRLQIEDRGKVSFSYPKGSSEFQIAPLILIVFIENAFKHSQAGQSDNILIEMDLQIDDNGLLDFRCTNSYHDAQSTENLNQGIGLENVKKRLKLLYPGKHTLKIERKAGLFRVHLRMQLNQTYPA